MPSIWSPSCLQAAEDGRRPARHHLCRPFIRGSCRQARPNLRFGHDMLEKSWTKIIPRLASKHALAGAYEANGQLGEAVGIRADLYRVSLDKP